MKPFLGILLMFFSLSWAENGYADDEKISEILREAVGNMYVNPGRIVHLGDSLLSLPHLDDETKIEIHMAMVSGYAALRDSEKSVESATAAEKLVSKDTPLKTRIRIYQVMGSQYHSLKLYVQAIGYFEQADLLIEALPDKADLDLYRGYNNVSKAFIYRDQMGCDVALKYFEKAVRNYKAVIENLNGIKNLSTTYYNKGNCEVSLQMLDSAEQSFKLAIAFAEKSQALSLMAFAQKGLAVMYTSKGQYDASLQLLEKALSNAKGVGDMVLNQGILRAISDNYLALGDQSKYDLYSLKTAEIQAKLTQNQRKSVARTLEDLVQTNNALIRQTQNGQSLYGLGLVAAIGVFASLAFVWRRRGAAQRASFRAKISALQKDAA